MRSWNERNKDKIATRNRDYKIKYPDKYQNSRLKHHYGITLDQYRALNDAQGGKCAICRKEEHRFTSGSPTKVNQLAVDHCHKTKRVRGLLCAHCNSAIGHVRDDPEILRVMIEYLER